MTASRRTLAPLVAVLAALGGACDHGLTLHVEARVGLGVSPDPASSGATLTFTLSNTGEVDVGADGARFVFLVESAQGEEVRRVGETSGVAVLAAGEALSASWDQRDAAGNPVLPGEYTVSVRFRAEDEAFGREASFTIE